MSEGSGILEHMFDSSLLPGPAGLAVVDDAAVVGAIEGWARASAAADARRLAAIAELVRRRCEVDEDDERARWACDLWDCAAAEVAAALNLGHGRAVTQLHLSVTLRDRLPKLNAVFLAGSVTAATVSTIAWRTLLVEDPEALARLDAAVAEQALGWGPLSDYKLVQAVDYWVDRFDPAAVRRTQSAARARNVTVGERDDSDGTAAIWGRLLGTDATLLDRRLTAMASGVCEEDPRTLAQRRADALGALAAGADHLACGCGAPACPAAAEDHRASSVVVHIVADPSALQAEPDPAMHGDHPTPTDPTPAEHAPADPASAEPAPAEPAPADPTPAPAAPAPADPASAEPTPADPAPADPAPADPAPADPAPATRPAAGVISGGGIVPAPLLAALIRAGAKVRFVGAPSAQAEPRYRPGTALAEFIRVRDLTCRFPGCDRPAEFADIDHTIAWPTGLTHPSNLKCLCRKHHLLRTFWTGEGGWADRLLPDGTLQVTTPAGRTYTTRPGSALLFPGWNTTTAAPPATPITTTPTPGRAHLMPQRKRTRAQDRAYRIKAERDYNAARIAAGDKPANAARITAGYQPDNAARIAENEEPPPF